LREREKRVAEGRVDTIMRSKRKRWKDTAPKQRGEKR
jgi:hypothetical protein